MNSAVVFWLSLAGLFLVVEILTVGLVSVWFVIGAVFATAAAALGAGTAVQACVFIAVSALLLVFMMPAAKRMIQKDKHATNFDRIMGMTAEVTEDIDDIEGKGQIKVAGAVWSAKSADGAGIKKGELVEITAVEGVRAVVKKKESGERL